MPPTGQPDHQPALPGGQQPVTVRLLAPHPAEEFRRVPQMRAEFAHHREAGGDVRVRLRLAQRRHHAATGCIAWVPIATRFHRLIMPTSTVRLAIAAASKCGSNAA